VNKRKQIIGRVISDIKEYWIIAPAVLILYVALHKIMGAFCPSVWITGFSCPGCGMTRAFLFVLTGQFARAFRINPSIYLWIVFGIYFIIQRYIRGKSVKGGMLFISIIVCIMLIIYIHGMLTGFPSQHPYVYTPDNVLEKYIPGYEQVVRSFINKRM